MNLRTKGKFARKQSIFMGRSHSGPPENEREIAAHRQILADLCRTIGATLRGEVARNEVSPQLPKLSPRKRQTLQRLLAGDSEKQIAKHLSVSPHTVHVYVKALYKGFDVQSRGELLAKFVRPATLRNVGPARSESAVET